MPNLKSCSVTIVVLGLEIAFMAMTVILITRGRCLFTFPKTRKMTYFMTGGKMYLFGSLRKKIRKSAMPTCFNSL